MKKNEEQIGIRGKIGERLNVGDPTGKREEECLERRM